MDYFNQQITIKRCILWTISKPANQFRIFSMWHNNTHTVIINMTLGGASIIFFSHMNLLYVIACAAALYIHVGLWTWPN
jgi:hypothetical protein